MAIEYKYGKVTLEHSNIGENEPVVVFRAQDLMLPEVLDAYHDACKRNGSPAAHLSRIKETRRKICEWQSDPTHTVRAPD